ncbi:hypothetical protein Lalb_Chr12g0207041 [Lupinus albus]|uniref:Uncharacterized protein n=1 Tax=Lupinus albus TaxID=3870 RepID=A0A6A4PNN6_LUPAL|nr:hypothetical protein Lalb_Chr12g0207041 [Lupinus albus]
MSDNGGRADHHFWQPSQSRCNSTTTIGPPPQVVAALRLAIVWPPWTVLWVAELLSAHLLPTVRGLPHMATLTLIPKLIFNPDPKSILP